MTRMTIEVNICDKMIFVRNHGKLWGSQTTNHKVRRAKLSAYSIDRSSKSFQCASHTVSLNLTEAFSNCLFDSPGLCKFFGTWWFSISGTNNACRFPLVTRLVVARILQHFHTCSVL